MKIRKYFSRIYFMLVILLFIPYHNSESKTWYVDPLNGDMNNAGDIENPWDTLENVFRQHKDREMTGGDSLLLLNGFHGSPVARGKFTTDVVIAPYKNHQPALNSVSFSVATKIKLLNVTISPETSPEYAKTTLIKINSSASEIVVENCQCYSVLDNAVWTQSDWSGNSCSGASIEGSNNVIKDCHFTNVKHGILVESNAAHNLIEGNIVENFAADGMRGIGSYNTFQYNTIKNCYDVDDNHDDGFQSYSYGPDGVGKTTVYGLVLRGNTIIGYTDPKQKFKGTLQGIGCFDGMYEDWLIENNVIITDHWHGISLYGAKNCKIVNNTVVDLNNTSPGPPWIKITAHKDGTKSTDNVVMNNLTTDVSNDANIGKVGYNMIITGFSRYDDYFVDFDNFDLRLVKGCRAIDAGTSENAPATDILGTSRPQGDGVDIGAYEYTDLSGIFGQGNIQPETFGLTNYPNPFNPNTMIGYLLPYNGHVELSVYNVLGEHISTLVNESQKTGEHVVPFRAEQLASGIYFCKINVDGFEQSRAMILKK